MYFYLLPAMNLFYFIFFFFLSPIPTHTHKERRRGNFVTRVARKAKKKESKRSTAPLWCSLVTHFPVVELTSIAKSFLLFFTFPPSSFLPVCVCVCVSSRLNIFFIFLQNRLFDDDEKKMITAIVSIPNQLEIVSLS